MNESPTTERLFSMSCFEGIRLLRQYNQEYPDLKITELKELIIKIEADAASLDMDAAIYLHPSVSSSYLLDTKLFYQECIKAVVSHQPTWAKLMRRGRMRFINSLESNSEIKDDNIDIFTTAGLLQNPPSEDIVTWWDNISGHARTITDIKKMKQAREAEKLTIEHEKQRLGRIGITKTPEWKGLDDNYAGYDVLSFDMKNGSETNLMIEVKSASTKPPFFHLSRNEWNKANESGENYIFHLWNMKTDPPKLHKVTVDQVKPHIPSDNKNGEWWNVKIPFKIKDRTKKPNALTFTGRTMMRTLKLLSGHRP